MSTVPPWGASTRAAALARRNAKSTVSGCSPTRPRTPSVPKYLRAIEILSLEHRGCDTHRVHGGGDVVGAHDTRSMENRNGGQRHAAVDATFYRPSGDLREHVLSRQAHGQRRAECLETRELPQQHQVVHDEFAEAETGIDRDARGIDARVTAHADTRRQEGAHVR